MANRSPIAAVPVISQATCEADRAYLPVAAIPTNTKKSNGWVPEYDSRSLERSTVRSGAQISNPT